MLLSARIKRFFTGCSTGKRRICDGGATTYCPSEKCDGVKNCRDGSDEDGCKKFQCCDGSTVNAYRQCDGFQDCDDGSDELFCRDCKSKRALDNHPRHNLRVIFSHSTWVPK